MRLLIKIKQFIIAIFVILVSTQFVYSEDTILLSNLQPPPTPTLVAPRHNADNISPRVKFVWNSSTDADYYRLKIWTPDWWWSPQQIIFDDSTLTDTTFQLDTLRFNKEYRWCVSARNDSGSSSFSPIWRFTTHLNDAPKIVVPITVRNNANDSIMMHFGVAVGATYCIDEEFGEYELPPCAPWVLDFRFVDHRRGAASCLGPVGVWLHLQGWEKYAKRDTFLSLFRSETYPIKFNWPSNLSEFFSEMVLRVPPLPNLNMLTDSSLILDDSLYFVAYLRIIGTPIPFGIPATPVLLSPPDNASIFSGYHYLEWKQSIKAYRYWLQVSTDSNFATTIINDSTIKTTSFLFTNIEPFVTYYWRVLAFNSEGSSNFSDAWSFILSPCDVNDDPIIRRFSLSQNYPNPFNSQSVVSYEI
ncbi:MAG: fibronectin type III domain-containing protein, partial [Bacteroidota bacterium]|nr:fibronectin type III domain-containing protein [Bacteroidota bacterium]